MNILQYFQCLSYKEEISIWFISFGYSNKYLEAGGDLGVCILNLQIAQEKAKSPTAPRDKRNI